jgi:tRNA dimethylallyltransferase
MFRTGLVAEVEELLDRYPRQAHAFQAIGYRQVVDYLSGGRSLEDAVDEMKRESRRYAKRQLTWFRSDPEIIWLAADRDVESVTNEASGLVRRFIRNGSSGTGPSAVRS